MDLHRPSAVVSCPLFEGSGTGITHGDSPQFPSLLRGVCFIDDWTVRRLAAQDEWVCRGASVRAELLSTLESRGSNEGRETWTAWMLRRLLPGKEMRMEPVPGAE